MALSREKFLQSLPAVLLSQLPPNLQGLKVRQPWRWLVQFHYGEPALHYEVSGALYRPGWEIGFHCEAHDHQLNRYLLYGFRRHLFEIKDVLGPTIEAEMWDKGWTKIYEVYPAGELTDTYQLALSGRLAAIINCIHPIYVYLRNNVATVYH